MTPGIFLHSFGCVNDKKRCLSTGRARDHIFQEFDVAGRIDDGVSTLSRFKKTRAVSMVIP
jgi:hypothetical protein